MSTKKHIIPISLAPEFLLKKFGIEHKSAAERFKNFEKLILKNLGDSVNYSLPKKDK
jgi:hypothetical protein